MDIIDAPTHRSVFEELTIEQQERLLVEIRERRLASLKVYEELLEAKKAVRDEKLSTKVAKLATRVAKQLEAADKAMNTVESLHREIRAARILMESEA